MSERKFKDIQKQREEEDDKEREIQKVLNRDRGENKFVQADSAQTIYSAEEFQNRAKDVEILIHQVDNLYRQYMVGLELRPPIEKRAALDTALARLDAMAKATPAAKFRYNALISRFRTYLDRWERLVKDVESGKIKRTARRD